MNKRSWKMRQALFLVFALFVPASALPESTAPSGVAYDRISDRISIAVEQQALSEVLRNIGGQTGIDVRLDPQADGKVSLNIDRLPLETALDRLGHLNVVKQYRPAGKGKKKLLVRISVLPAGKADPDAAVRLLDADKEVDMRAMAMTASMQEMARQHAIQEDLMMQRWKSRLRDLAPAQKKHYEEQMKEFAVRDAKLQQRMAADEASRQQMREKTLGEMPAAARRRTLQDRSGVDPDPAAAARAQRDFPLGQTPAIVYPDQQKQGAP